MPNEKATSEFQAEMKHEEQRAVQRAVQQMEQVSRFLNQSLAAYAEHLETGAGADYLIAQADWLTALSRDLATAHGLLKQAEGYRQADKAIQFLLARDAKNAAHE